MADNENKKLEDELSKKSSLSIFGTNDDLTKESENLRSIIRQTMIDTSQKYGGRAKGKVINYFNELNFGTAFADLLKKPGQEKDKKSDINPNRAFKKYMSEQDLGSISGILLQESGRMIAYSNYKAIYTHIPEAAQALDTFKDNIMSPDDFTKLIFNVHYDNKLDEKFKAKIEGQFDDIIGKYGFEELADEIIEGSLLYGDQYVAVLSLEEELNDLLSDPIIGKMGTGAKILTENLAKFDLSVTDVEVNKTDIPDTKLLMESFVDAFHLKEEEKSIINEDLVKQTVAQLINKNVSIGSKKELILERLSAESQKNADLDFDDINGKKKKEKESKRKKNDSKPLYINGSSLRILDPSKVVELKIDNVIYGYYYVEGMDIGGIPNAGYLGQSTGREVLNPVTMGSNIITTNNSKFTPNSSNFSATGLSDEKVNIISRIFLDTLSKKINKDFVRHNKEFKDFIYSLVRQDYILKKEIKMTFFPPNEVVAFKVPALYRKIVFFAKLYLAMLTNMLLVKMGRAHDKRIFYVDVGADSNYEQAITRVIQDIKTKEFKMDSIGDINTILNLNPGYFDNWYIPTVNNEKPIEIDTLQGMDVDLNNDFLEFLKQSMMSGMGIPRTLIDETAQVDFARTLSARNANFVRGVIKYQKRLTEPFTKMFRILYENEYKFNNDKESDLMSFINLKDIKVSFPSPASLNMTNLTDQIQVADGNAEFISNTLVPPDPTGASDQEKLKLKQQILEDLLPAVDWSRYKELHNDVKNKLAKQKVKNLPPPPQDDGMGGM
jgi:hypothetical protein